MISTTNLRRLRAVVALSAKLDKAAKVNRLAAQSAIKKGQLSRALVLERSGRFYLYLRGIADDSPYVGLVQLQTGALAGFPSNAAAVREAKSLGIQEKSLELESIVEAQEEDRIRLALLDLFAHVLPGEPKEGDWRLIKDIASRGVTQVVTLDGPIKLRTEAMRAQCFSRSVISHGRGVFTSEEHVFAFPLRVERRGWNENSHYHLYVKEIFLSRTPLLAEAIDRAPSEFERDWDFPQINPEQDDDRIWFPPHLGSTETPLHSMQLTAPNGLPIVQLRSADGNYRDFIFSPPSQYVLQSDHTTWDRNGCLLDSSGRGWDPQVVEAHSGIQLMTKVR